MTVVDYIHGHKAHPAVPVASAAIAQELAAQWGLPDVGYSVRRTRVVGEGSGASIEIELSPSGVMRFETVRDFTNPKHLAVELCMAAGVTPKLTLPQIMEQLRLGVCWPIASTRSREATSLGSGGPATSRAPSSKTST